VGGGEFEAAVRWQSGSGGNEPSDDDVLLEADQFVLLAAHGRFGQHAGRLLERGRREEAFGRQRGFGDAQQHPVRRRLLSADIADAGVLVLEDELIYDLARQEPAVARMPHLALPKHLPDDDLDVLIVDVHALALVDALDLAHQIVLHAARSLQLQDFLRVQRAFRQAVARMDSLADLDLQLAAIGNQVDLAEQHALDTHLDDLLERLIGDLLSGLDDGLAALIEDVFGGDGVRPQALVRQRLVEFLLRVDDHVAQAPALDSRHDAGMLRNDGLALRLARLEQFHDAQQTAHLVFQHFQHRLNGAHALPLGTLGLLEVDDTALNVLVQFAQGTLPLLLDVGNAGQVLACDASRVERAHRQLRAGFADGLRRDDARRHADVHQPPG